MTVPRGSPRSTVYAQRAPEPAFPCGATVTVPPRPRKPQRPRSSPRTSPVRPPQMRMVPAGRRVHLLLRLRCTERLLPVIRSSKLNVIASIGFRSSAGPTFRWGVLPAPGSGVRGHDIIPAIYTYLCNLS